MPSLPGDQSGAGHGEGALQHATPTSRHQKPHSHTSWASRLRRFCSPSPPLRRRLRAGPGTDSQTGGSCGVLQGPGQWGPVPALADARIPGSAGTLMPTRSLKPCCAPLPWTRHTPPPWSPSETHSPLMPARCEAIKGPAWVTPSQMRGGQSGAAPSLRGRAAVLSSPRASFIQSLVHSSKKQWSPAENSASAIRPRGWNPGSAIWDTDFLSLELSFPSCDMGMIKGPLPRVAMS